MLPSIAITTLHRLYSSQKLSVSHGPNIVLVKTLCNVVQETLENITQEKILFNVVLIYSWDNIAQVKTLSSIVLEAQDNNTQEKIIFNVVWTKSLYRNFYFGPVNFLIMTGCCKYHANIAQIFPALHKKYPRPTLNKKTRLFQSKGTYWKKNKWKFQGGGGGGGGGGVH